MTFALSVLKIMAEARCSNCSQPESSCYQIAQLKLLIDQNSNLCKNLQEASEHKVYSIHVYLYILPSCAQVYN